MPTARRPDVVGYSARPSLDVISASRAWHFGRREVGVFEGGRISCQKWFSVSGVF